MALDKLVDSSQLDANLTSIANAIRAKGGTSAQLAFPAEFVSAIQPSPAVEAIWSMKRAHSPLLRTMAEELVAIRSRTTSGKFRL